MDRKRLLALVVAAALAWLVFGTSQQGGESRPKQKSVLEPSSALGPNTTHEPVASPSPDRPPAASQLTREEVRKLFETPIRSPELPKIREEISRNPHLTPPSLLSFGAELGARLSVGLESEGRAREFLRQMSECVQGGQGPEVRTQSSPSAEAMCLLHGKWATDRYPVLRSELEELEARASAEARRIYQQMSGTGSGGDKGNP